MKCDLHLHSNLSDGAFSPENLVDMAKERGLDCISVTDHDCFEGSRRARQYAREVGMGYVVGAEISTLFNGVDVHILAYNVDIDNPELIAAMKPVAELRDKRNRAIAAKLSEQGMPIDLDELNKRGFVGRPIIAHEMVRLGYCKDAAEAFDKYLGTGKSCFVQTTRLTPVEAIQLTLRYGGLPVLAHPKQLRLGKRQVEEFIKSLASAGLAGIEAEYFAHNTEERVYYNRLAKRYRLISTGGSDFHDYVHGIEIGTQSFSPNGFTCKVLGI